MEWVYFFAVLGIFGLLLICFWSVFTERWERRVKENGAEAMWLGVVNMANVFHGFKIQPNYMNFKMSVVRHSVVSLISACIMYFAFESKNAVIAIIVLNALYATVAEMRYHEYRKEANTGALGGELVKMADDALFVVVHAVICLGALFVREALAKAMR